MAVRSATEWALVIGAPCVAFKFPRCTAVVAAGTAAALITRRWWRGLLVSLVSYMHRPAQTVFASVAQERVAKDFNALIQRNDGDGCGIFLVDGPNGRFEFATGQVSSLSCTQATIDTRFEIASVMKMMVSYAILKLVSAKTLSLDARAADYVSLDASAADLGNVTVRQLLTHTSGLPDIGKDGTDYTLRELASNVSLPSPFVHPLTTLWCGLALAWYGDIRMNKFKFNAQATPMLRLGAFNRIWNPTDALELVLREYEICPPGSHSYSDSNYTILGLMLEHIHKSAFHDILKREVLDPLQMRDTYYRFSHIDHGADDSQLSSRYRNSKGKFPFWRSDWTFPDYTLASCPLLTVPPCYVSACGTLLLTVLCLQHGTCVLS